MYYKAKNVDTDKALDAINEARKIQEQQIALERAKIEAKMEGIYKGLSIVESIFECSNYEKDGQPIELSYTDGVLGAIYEIGKELDVPTQDLRENMESIDETICALADRIKARFKEMEGES